MYSSHSQNEKNKSSQKVLDRQPHDLQYLSIEQVQHDTGRTSFPQTATSIFHSSVMEEGFGDGMVGQGLNEHKM